MKNFQTKKAENIRNVIRYLQKFKNALVVIYIDDKTIESPLFSSHIRDIALIHEAGLKVVIIPGARSRIDELLSSANIKWSVTESIRITPSEAMPIIKMAAFDVSNSVMTSLAANNITAIIGNWVRARAKGIINGLDYGTAGDIERLQTDAIRTVLNDGFIPIFPCIGWNAVGHPYNISSTTLAQKVAIALNSDKLFYLTYNGGINTENFNIPSGFSLSENGDVPAMNLDEVDEFISANPPENSKNAEIISLFKLAKEACLNNVSRVHILNGRQDGVLPCEIFSDLGSGTMIYTSDYGKIRPMVQTDIPAVLRVMRPFVENGKLLPRTEQQLNATINDFIVYEVDGGVHACSCLHEYSDGQMEIAAVAVDESFSHMGIGPKMIHHFIEVARARKAESVFIMTTQAADWFEKLGFEQDDIESLPDERRQKWTQERNSKVFRLKNLNE